VSGQTRLLAVVVGAIVLAGGMIAVILFINPVDQFEPFVEIIGKSSNTADVTLSEMQALTVIEREGSFQNSYGNLKGQGFYKGVKIADLISLVGGMETSDVVIVNASDGYSQIFTYQNVYPNESIYSIQGDFILAFEYNGTIVPEYAEGYRIMFLPEDGYFSNDDANSTIEPQFYGGAAGPKCVSDVATIQLADRPEPLEPVEPPEQQILGVRVGSVIESFTMSEILAMNSVTGQGGFRNSYGTLVGPHTYVGVPVYNLLKSVEILPESYEVLVNTSDNYPITYNQSIVEGTTKGYNSTTGESIGQINVTMVLAHYENGEEVSDGPFRIVFLNEDGYLTDSFLWAKFVVNITVNIISTEPPALKIISGDSTLTYTLEEIWGLPYVSGYGGYKKSSGTLVGPYNYTGITILYLLEQSGSIPENYSIEVKAEDGYKTTFNRTEVEGQFQGYNMTNGESVGVISCTLVLAYQEEGESIDIGGPLRIATLNETYFTDGRYWSKSVVEIRLINEVES
jgi:hypothetical protein